MEIIQLPRAAGKTHRLIADFRAAPGSRFVVAAGPERDRLIRVYGLSPEEQRRVVVAAPGTLRGTSGEVFVDNADWILAMFLGQDVDKATVNGPER